MLQIIARPFCNAPKYLQEPFATCMRACMHTMSLHPAASVILQKRQLQLYGKMLRSPETHPLNSVSLVPSLYWKPRTDQYVHRRRRPNREWVPDVTKIALNISGNYERLRQIVQSKQSWNDTLYNHFKFESLLKDCFYRVFQKLFQVLHYCKFT